jgi:long-subunit fatty acid transport protein
MKMVFATASVLAMGVSGVLAGGIDRSGQDIGIIFEDGGYIELSFGVVTPSVSGTVGGGAVSSGNMAPSYTQTSFGIKQEISETLSFALILDHPFGANVDYPGVFGDPYPFAGTTAEITSGAVTALGRYKIGDRISVHGGARYQTMSGAASIPIVDGYVLDASGSGGFGFVAGAAYEIPEIALRVAVTYSSAISHTLTGTETTITTGAVPLSIGIATP